MTTPRKSSRRAFLAGRSAIDAVQDLADQWDRLDPESSGAEYAPAEQSAYLLQVGRRAMACQFEVFFDGRQFPQGVDAAVAALDRIEQLEQQLSVYRADSEVSRLNARAAAGSVAVESQLFGLLRRAAELYEWTGGAFDITSGPLTKTWGFFRREGRVPTADEIATALQLVGSRHLEFDADAETIGFAVEGLEINLGSIGKGYALDRGADLLHERELSSFLIHGGASSLLARGTSPENAKDGRQGWPVATGNPARPGRPLLEIDLCDAGLGTSGSAVQHFHYRGKKYGHILDPRSGWPAERVLSATAVCPTAAEADALATAFFVMGVDETAAFCRQCPEAAAILVTAGDRAGAIELHTFNTDKLSWRRVDE